MLDAAAARGLVQRRPCATADLRLDEGTACDLDQPPDAPTADRVAAFVRHDHALTVGDVLSRRTRWLLLDARHALELAPHVARAIAAERGKPQAWVAAQCAAFERTAQAFRV